MTLTVLRLSCIVLLGITTFVTPVVTAFTSPGDLPVVPQSLRTNDGNAFDSDSANKLNVRIRVDPDKLRQDWIERSVAYYSKLMRENRRRNIGQVDASLFASDEYQRDFLHLAKKHYFALRKIKDGQHRHAELIYRRIIDELMEEEEEEGHCDHAKLAVTTLLLALHCQRMGDAKKTRSVFLSFFRVAVVEAGEDGMECACSAKVLGAYALFEMKQGNRIKSLEIARKAVQYDHDLQPLLHWKQFREVAERLQARRRP